MQDQERFTMNSRPGRRVSVTARALRRYLSERFGELGLGAGQYLYLLYLFDEEGCTQEELARRAFVDCGCTARALRKLEDEGFVTRRPHEEDRRRNRVLLTQKAKRSRQRYQDVLVEAEARLTSGFSSEELRQLEGLLERLEANARRMADER